VALVAVQSGTKIAWSRNRPGDRTQRKAGKSWKLIYVVEITSFGDTHCLSAQDNIYALMNTLYWTEDDLKTER